MNTLNEKGVARWCAAHGPLVAMEPRRFAALAEVLAEDGETAPQAAQPSLLKTGRGSTAATVYVQPIHGVLDKPVYEQISAGVESAKARADALVLDVDSPGGSTSGLFEAAEVIHDARDFLPVVAVVNTLAASAAY